MYLPSGVYLFRTKIFNHTGLLPLPRHSLSVPKFDHEISKARDILGHTLGTGLGVASIYFKPQSNTHGISGMWFFLAHFIIHILE